VCRGGTARRFVLFENVVTFILDSNNDTGINNARIIKQDE